MPASVNITALTFGRWAVLAPAGRNRHRQGLYRVRCLCGTLALRTAAELRQSGSCGCARAELVAERNRAGRGGRRPPLPPRPCDHCGAEYLPRRAGSKHCSQKCRTAAGWARVAADPARRAAHARRVTLAHKESSTRGRHARPDTPLGG